MVNGTQLDYSIKKGQSSKFNQKMFGRISTRTAKTGATYSYYVPGVLHNIPHSRVFEGRIFIGTTADVDYDPIMSCCDKFQVSSVSKSENDLLLKTGKERWMFHTKERGIQIGWN